LRPWQQRAVSAMDVTHRLVFTASYQLPIGRGKAIGRIYRVGVIHQFKGGTDILEEM